MNYKGVIMKIHSLVIGLLSTTVMSLSPFVHASDSDVLAFICDSCSYDEAKKIVKSKASPGSQCKADNNDMTSVGEMLCYSDLVYSAVLNQPTGALWGFRLSYSKQGPAADTMKLQVEEHQYNQTIEEMIKNGAQYTQDLSAGLQNVASKVSSSFSSSAEYEQWLNDRTEPKRSAAVRAKAPSSEFSCIESSEYLAVKAITSGEFRNRLRAKINSVYSNQDIQLTGNFEDAEFTDYGLRLEKAGFTVLINWDNQRIDKTPFFIFSNPDLLATKNNQEISQVAFRLSPSGNGTLISLDGTKTHLSGDYWSVMTSSGVTPLEVSPCAAEALSEAYGTASVSATGDTGSDNYNPKPGKGSPFLGGAPEEDTSRKNPLCEARYSDKLGKPVITIKVLC